MKEIAFMAAGLIALQFGCFLVGKNTTAFSVRVSQQTDTEFGLRKRFWM
jgi:hypothetical protein